MSKVLVRCKPSLTNTLLEKGYEFSFSKEFGAEELEVILDLVEDEVIGFVKGKNQDPDQLFCEYYGLDWDQVFCVECIPTEVELEEDEGSIESRTNSFLIIKE